MGRTLPIRVDSPAMRVTREEFEALVERAVEGLPDEFKSMLDNVAVMVEEEPTDEDLEEVLGALDDAKGVVLLRPDHPSLGAGARTLAEAVLPALGLPEHRRRRLLHAARD